MKFNQAVGLMESLRRNDVDMGVWTKLYMERNIYENALTFTGQMKCGHFKKFKIDMGSVLVMANNPGALVDLYNQEAHAPCEVCRKAEKERRPPIQQIPPAQPSAYYGIDRSVEPGLFAEMYAKRTAGDAVDTLAAIIKVIVTAWAQDVVDDTMRFAAVLELDLDKLTPQAPKRVTVAKQEPWVREYLGLPPAPPPEPEWHNQLEIDP